MALSRGGRVPSRASPIGSWLGCRPRAHLRMVTLERGRVLHAAGDDLAHVWFPQRGMVSLVAVMRDGSTVETTTVGRDGVIGAAAGLGSRRAHGRAIVQLPGSGLR